MPALFAFEVHTPYRPFFSGKVESITLSLSDGEIGVFAHHSSFTAPAQCCILKMKDDQGGERFAFITDGILEVKEHKTVLIVETAEWPEEIDTERARRAKQSAQEELKSATQKFKIDSAQTKLRRAEYRLKAAELKK